ncbi:hypothetical protein BKA70DRAFT_1223585 [Coprinopsis sp. MPI-PUGE-AT-0042]|nr:hypothetical protein BKA70DRAFT_1223585 [Coprinopsis sp. MPI-PUGE-AT-0042]
MPCQRSKKPPMARAAATSLPLAREGYRGAPRNPNVAHFLRWVQAAQVKTTFSSPVILHWASSLQDLQPWGWCAEALVTYSCKPDLLTTHEGRWIRRQEKELLQASSKVIEGPITLWRHAVFVHQSSAKWRPGALLNGEYVVECALRLCGYFESPLPAAQIAYITDFDTRSHESLGLYQAFPVDGVLSRGGRQGLHVEPPFGAGTASACSNFMTLWSKGLGENDFWQLFLQQDTKAVEEYVQEDDDLQLSDEEVESTSGDTEIIEWNGDE